MNKLGRFLWKTPPGSASFKAASLVLSIPRVPGCDGARRSNPRDGKFSFSSQDARLNSVHIKYQQVLLPVGRMFLRGEHGVSLGWFIC